MSQQDEHGARTGLLDQLDDLRTILDDGIADEDIPVLQDEITADGAIVPLLGTALEAPATPADPQPLPMQDVCDTEPQITAHATAAELEARIDAVLDAWVRETLQPELDALRARLVGSARELLLAADLQDAGRRAGPSVTERTHGQ